MTDRRVLFVLILAITAMGIMGNTLLAPAVPDILDDFGVRDSGAGLLIAATSFPGIFMAPIVGILADRLGRRRVLVPCLTIFGISGIASALAPSFTALIIARVGMGAGAAGLINLAVVLIGDHWNGGDRTRLIGRNAAFLTVCLAILPPVGGILTDVWSWRVALAPNGLGLLVAIGAWRVLTPGKPAVTVTLREQIAGIREIVRRPEVILLLVGATVSFVMMFGVFLSTMPIHLRDQFGYGATTRGLFLALPAVTSTLVAFNVQRIRSYIDPWRLLVGCSLLFAAGFALIGAAEVAMLIVLGCIVYGAGEGALLPTLQDLSVQLSPPEHRGAIVAIYVGAARLGQTIGPLGAAAVFGATSTFAALHLGVALAVALAAIFLFAPKHPPDSDEPGARIPAPRSSPRTPTRQR